MTNMLCSPFGQRFDPPNGYWPVRLCQLSQVTNVRYSGSALQSDGDMNTDVNKRTQCVWNNWKKISGVLYGKRIPPNVNSPAAKDHFFVGLCIL